MKLWSLLLLAAMVYGCPAYDPPTGVLKIFNASDSAVYVYESCTDSIQMVPELTLFHVIPGMTDAKGRQINPIRSPHYRVNAYAYSEFDGFGSPETRSIPCQNQEYVTFFFIPESIMRTHTWQEICQQQLYHTRIEANLQMLDSLDWVLQYTP
ncbi:MAG: hypothetical protein SF053_10405 [Bacteroidia bacterium]|nr:hypothetical protein [Bacteroidia bacterium]